MMRLAVVSTTTKTRPTPLWAPAWGLALIGIAVCGRFDWWLELSIGVLAIAGPMAVVWDAAEHRLPNRIVLPAWLAAIAIQAAAAIFHHDVQILLQSIGAAGLIAGGLLLATYLPGTGLGMGDVKFAGMLAQVTGTVSVSAALGGLALSFVLGGLFAAVLMARHRATLKTRIALGPALLGGASLVLLGAGMETWFVP